MKPSAQTTRKAVALSYAADQMAAPIVTAKGSGEVAEMILKKAKEHGVPVQENASLVEILSQLELEQQIPNDLYSLVAEILTFVYRSDQRAGGL